MAQNRDHRLTSSKGYTERIIATRDPIPTFLIVCEGEKTEPNYFRSFPISTRPEITIVGIGSLVAIILSV